MLRAISAGHDKKDQGQEDADRRNTDQAILQDIAWHDIVNKRLTAATSFAQSEELQAKLIIDAILHEPHRLLTMWFLQCSVQAKPTCKFPALMDLARPQSSPVVVAQQHLAALTLGHAPRLKLLCGFPEG